MDDYSMSSLSDSKNEWCVRLVNILTPAIVDGLKSIFKEALELCEENGETDKYLMTFQTFLTRIPKWNETMIKNETTRIENMTKCGYLADLITCVHVIQLKALTCARVGLKQKKIDIDIPSVNEFIHKTYIDVARKLYSNVYLFETNTQPLQIQKNNREIETFVKESILNTVRNTMPVETILRAYMDETEEEDVEVEEEVVETPINDTINETLPNEIKQLEVNEDHDNKDKTPMSDGIKTEDASNISSIDVVPGDLTLEDKKKFENENEITSLSDDVSNLANISFSNTDDTQDILGNESSVSAPKTIERLEQIAIEAAERRKIEEADDDEDDEDNEKITIGESVSINVSDIDDINKQSVSPPILNDIEIIA